MTISGEVISIILTFFGLMQGTLFYMLNSINVKFKEARAERDRLVSEVHHKEEKLEIRVRTLETHSITETKTKQLIDDAVKPLKDSLEDLKLEQREHYREQKDENKNLQTGVHLLTVEVATLISEMKMRRKGDQ